MRKFLSGIGIAALVVAGTAGAATASVATKHYTGLYVSSGNKNLGEIDRTTSANNLAEKDTSYSGGDRMFVQAPNRDLQPSNGNSVHVTVDWSKNTLDCGLSGVSVAIDGVGIDTSCNINWKGSGSNTSPDHGDGGWWFYSAWKFYDGTSGMYRAGVHICQTQWNSDPCSGNRWLTTTW